MSTFPQNVFHKSKKIFQKILVFYFTKLIQKSVYAVMNGQCNMSVLEINFFDVFSTTVGKKSEKMKETKMLLETGNLGF